MATISLSSDGSGTLSYDGKSVACKGLYGFDYTRDVTVGPDNCYESKYSNEFGVHMYYAVGPIQWRRGAYIHQGDTSSGSYGCIKLDDAKSFHDWVKNRSSGTRIQISYPW